MDSGYSCKALLMRSLCKNVCYLLKVAFCFNKWEVSGVIHVTGNSRYMSHYLFPYSFIPLLYKKITVTEAKGFKWLLNNGIFKRVPVGFLNWYFTRFTCSEFWDLALNLISVLKSIEAKELLFIDAVKT